jgi:hypothetical protein
LCVSDGYLVSLDVIGDYHVRGLDLGSLGAFATEVHVREGEPSDANYGSQ